MVNATRLVGSTTGLLAPLPVSIPGTSPFTLSIEKLSRAATMAWKKMKRVFKNKVCKLQTVST
jgi:hypothetical protein